MSRWDTRIKNQRLLAVHDQVGVSRKNINRLLTAYSFASSMNRPFFNAPLISPGQSVCRLAAGWISCALVVMLMVCMPRTAQGSGCDYHADVSAGIYDGHAAPHRPQWVEWSTGLVYRVYRDGRVYYFQLAADTLPCRGPSCRQPAKGPEMRPLTIVQTDRVPTGCPDQEGRPDDLHQLGHRLFDFSQLPSQQPHDPPLRPPCG
ncbi:MAG: hypothetical protein KatS3mg111_2014 [Pirellulaceae bacterium]|nr:MAG: hypothetical protein KatS3mg111_2014 [Pirellulaceae bacterium]